MFDLDSAATVVRFCRRCGAPIQPETNVCVCEAASSAPPQRREQASGSIRGALALYFTLLATFLIVLFGDRVEYKMAIEIIDAMIVLAWCAMGWRLIGPGLMLPRSRWWWVWPVPLALLTFSVASMTIYPMVWWLGIEQTSYSEPYLGSGYGWAMVILFVCVQPAIIEELAFRGVVLKSLMRVLSAREAIVVSALMFMTLHLSVLSFPHLFFTGLVLGWLRVRCGSLLPGMILHFCHNLLCVVIEAMGY